MTPTVVACLGNRVGARVAAVLRRSACEVVCVVLNEAPCPGDEHHAPIYEALPAAPVVNAHAGLLRRSPADLCVMAGFRHRVPASFVRCFRRGVVNLHPSYLPFNRGSWPNVWAILDGTPAGATLHYVEADDEAGVDTGPIVARTLVPTYAWDTGRTLYDRCEDASVALLEEWWPSLLGAECPEQQQEHDLATFHTRADANHVDEVDPDRSYRARDLLDLLRARTFDDYPSAWFRDPRTGRKVYVRVSMEVE